MITARRTSAILGTLAFLYVGAAGLVQGTSVEWTLLRALIALVAFAVLGYVAGLVGSAIARDAAKTERDRRVAEAKREEASLSAVRPRGAGGSNETY